MVDFRDRFAQTNSQGQHYFSTVRSGLIVALLSIGTLMGALVAAPIADRIGRRLSISLWCIVVSVGFVIQIASITAWYQMMIGRYVAGLGVGALSLLVPMYQAETAPPWIRGALVCAYQLFITMGIFLAACFNYATEKHHTYSSASWRIVVGLGWLWTLILGVGILFFPETPRFDFRNGQEERAKRTLCKVYGTTPNHWSVYTQVEEIQMKLRAEDKIKVGPWREFKGMFRAPRMTYRIILGMGLQMFQQLTGANYFFYYGTTIFRSVQINSFITQIILNTINFLTTFFGLYMVEHYGRRKSLIAGSIWMFICFMIFASVGHFMLNLDDPALTPTPGIVLIVFACLFILGFATTWGPMIWTIQAEIFPSRYRAKGMALSTASNWIWNFNIGFFTPFITKAIDFRYGYVFAGCNILGALIVYFFVIEGQGRTIEEIDTAYLDVSIPRNLRMVEYPLTTMKHCSTSPRGRAASGYLPAPRRWLVGGGRPGRSSIPRRLGVRRRMAPLEVRLGVKLTPTDPRLRTAMALRIGRLSRGESIERAGVTVGDSERYHREIVKALYTRSSAYT
jgi:SP family sugar:H+ symporter-like MFS transporter